DGDWARSVHPVVTGGLPPGGARSRMVAGNSRFRGRRVSPVSSPGAHPSFTRAVPPRSPAGGDDRTVAFIHDPSHVATRQPSRRRRGGHKFPGAEWGTPRSEQRAFGPFSR